MSITTASVPTYRGYTFPIWSVVLGWMLAFSSVAAVPIVAILRWVTQRRARFAKLAATPERKSGRIRDKGSAMAGSNL